MPQIKVRGINENDICKISEKMILAEQEKTAISQQITKNELDIAEKKEHIRKNCKNYLQVKDDLDKLSYLLNKKLLIK